MKSGLERLADAGWKPSRFVDPEPAVELLAEIGIEVPDSVRASMAELDGLDINFERNDRPDVIRFSVKEAAENSEVERLKSYSRDAGCPLVPVGSARHGYITLFVSGDGRWFGGLDSELWLLGESVGHAIECIVAGTGHLEINGFGSS